MPLSPGLAQVRVFNSLPCNVTLNGTEVLPPAALWARTDIPAVGENVPVSLSLSGQCVKPGSKLDLILAEEKVGTVTTKRSKTKTRREATRCCC